MIEERDERLRLLVERIERLIEERDGITSDIRDVFSEAKAVGYDTKTLRTVIARRRMKPDDRAEADTLVETYEAALGGERVEIPDARPDLAALAIAMVAEQLEGIEDPAQAAALVEHVTVLLDIRAEIALLRQQESARKKLAAEEGFVAKQLGATVRWLEKCAKHGVEAMRGAEAVFHLYRGTVSARGLSTGTVRDDPALQKLAKPRGAKGGKLDATLAWLGMGNG